MQKRVGFVLTIAQVQQACEAFIAPRLLDDEEASAVVQADVDGTVICRIDVSKKRKPRTRRKNGGPA